MSGFAFELESEKIPRATRKKGVKSVLSGTAGPYGEVVITLSQGPPRAVLTAPALPETSLSHPDDLRNELLPLDKETSLIVGGTTAVLSQNRRALRNEDRGLEIRLGDRHYTYLAHPEGGQELRDHERGLLVRQRSVPGSSKLVEVQPSADATDLALDLILQVSDRSWLTVLGMVIVSTWTFFNTGKGEA